MTTLRTILLLCLLCASARAATNTAPQSPAIVRWISVQIAGDTNAWRLGLAK